MSQSTNKYELDYGKLKERFDELSPELQAELKAEFDGIPSTNGSSGDETKISELQGKITSRLLKQNLPRPSR